MRQKEPWEDAEREAKRALDLALTQNQAKVTSAISAILSIHFQGSFTRKDQMRMMNLVTWAEREKVPLATVLAFLLDRWRGKFPTRKALQGRLGVRISTLAGKRSKEMFLEWLKITYPNREQLISWKADQQAKILFKKVDTGSVSSDPFCYVAAYQRRIRKIRSQSDRLKNKFQRRRYRGNPFV